MGELNAQKGMTPPKPSALTEKGIDDNVGFVLVESWEKARVCLPAWCAVDSIPWYVASRYLLYFVTTSLITLLLRKKFITMI